MDHLINAKGEFLIDKGYDFIFPGRENRILVQQKGKSGFLDYTGQIVIPIEFDNNWLFSESLAPFEREEKWGYIDLEGKTIIAPKFEYCAHFRDGKATVKLNDKFGLIDRAGNWIAENQFDHAWNCFLTLV